MNRPNRVIFVGDAKEAYLDLIKIAREEKDKGVRIFFIFFMDKLFITSSISI